MNKKMADIFEQLKTKSAIQQPATAGGDIFNTLKQKSQTRPAEQPKERSVFGKVAHFLAPTATEVITGEKPLNLRTGIGAGLELASFAIPVGGVVKGAGLAAKGLGMAAKGLGRRALEAGTVGAVTGATQQAGTAIGEGEDVGGVVKRAATGALTGGVAGAIIPPLTGLAGKAIKKGISTVKPKESVDTLVGRITQGTRQEIAKSTEALKKLDTSGVKTYEDLRKITDDEIGKLAKKQDALLIALGDTHQVKDLATPIKIGKQTIKPNFVTSAVKQLKQLYSSTMDLENLTKIGQLEQKMIKQGITTKEINDLAREYGTEFASKAFNKIGEPLTAVNKVAFENTRKGLKATARRLLPGDASKAIDESMSNLFTLKRTSQKMEQAVQKLENKVKDRGILERMGRLIGRGVDLTTGGSLRGFMTSFLPSNIGNKVLNSLDLERELAKNLEKVNWLTKHGTDGQILRFINEIIKKSSPNLKKLGTSQIPPKISATVFGRSVIDQENP